MLPIQTPTLTTPLTKALGLKGQVVLGFDETTVGTIGLADYTSSPYASNPHPGQSQQQQNAAGALEFSGLIIQAPPNAIVRVEELQIINENSAAMVYAIRWINPGDIALLNLNTTVEFRDANAMSQRTTGTRLGTVILRVNHTALLGQGLVRFAIPVMESRAYTFPDGFALYGNDPFGRSGVIVWGETLDSSVHATMNINEYKLPG